MTMITPSYLGETIEYSSLHACRSTLEDPTQDFAALSELRVAENCHLERQDFAALDRQDFVAESGRELPPKRCIEKMSLKTPPPPAGRTVSEAVDGASQPPGGGGEDSLEDQQNDRAFLEIEYAAGCSLDGVFRGALAADLAVQGFTPQHFAAWIKRSRLRGARNVPALLRTMGREFKLRAASYVWPNCLECRDTGSVGDRWCDCVRGKVDQEHGTDEAQVLEQQEQPESVCTRDTEMERRAEAAASFAALSARREELKAKGICPDCQGKDGGCDTCNGLGTWASDATLRAAGICCWCHGIGSMRRIGDRVCPACKGTGKAGVETSRNGRPSQDLPIARQQCGDAVVLPAARSASSTGLQLAASGLPEVLAGLDFSDEISIKRVHAELRAFAEATSPDLLSSPIEDATCRAILQALEGSVSGVREWLLSLAKRPAGRSWDSLAALAKEHVMETAR